MICTVSAALYSRIVRWVRVSYLVLRLYIGPLIKEEGDAGTVTFAGSPMQSGSSILQKEHTQTDRQTQIKNTEEENPIARHRIIT